MSKRKKKNHATNADRLATIALITVVLELVKTIIDLIQTIIEKLN